MDEPIPTKQLIAGRAAIVRDGTLLVIRESSVYEEGTNAGKYDLPGGRVQLGETIQEALIREAKEECGLDISIGEPLFVSEWRPTVKEEVLQITAIFFLCSADTGEVELSSDHNDFKWIGASGYGDLPIMNPIPEVIQKLIARGILT